MKVGVSLLRAKPKYWPEIVTAAEALGYESIWISDHLVIPVDMRGTYPGDAAAVGLQTIPRGGPTQKWPMFDSPVMRAALASRTTSLRFGTYVYLLGLRHPLVTARAWATLDIMTGGRILLGVGSGWLRSEWDAAGMDWARRGEDLDEAIDICRRLWSEDTVEHHGQAWSFEEVMFDPKPVQLPASRFWWVERRTPQCAAPCSGAMAGSRWSTRPSR
jgi:alkanesulfonate monooxygenase SsuD/methylene tetrahydromethanopterin reductase-like flavin-dependent oxidoreductase (luciferase family)